MLGFFRVFVVFADFSKLLKKDKSFRSLIRVLNRLDPDQDLRSHVQRFQCQQLFHFTKERR